jgi:hypothetical protein
VNGQGCLLIVDEPPGKFLDLRNHLGGKKEKEEEKDDVQKKSKDFKLDLYHCVLQQKPQRPLNCINISAKHFEI